MKTQDDLQLASLSGLDGDVSEEEAAGAPTPRVGAPARMLGPLMGLVARVAAPMVVLRGPLRFVPAPILTAFASALASVVLLLLLTFALGGAQSATEASGTHDLADAHLNEDVHAVAPIPTPRPRLTPTPIVPPATPTPGIFQPQDSGGWIAIGRPPADPKRRLDADRLLLLPDERSVFTLSTRMAVLTRAGDRAPFWGMMLGYADENNHLRLEFFSDAYEESHPYVALAAVVDGKEGVVGNTIRLPNLPFWGRDTHDLRAGVDARSVQLWLDGRRVAVWPTPPVSFGARKGVYLSGDSRMRFDAVELR